jgi:ABC-type transport system involved in cytochrome c biogenesis permease subunit
MPKLFLLHVPLLCLAYVMLLAGAVTGLVYLVQERQIKDHESPLWGSKLPSLEAMEVFVYRMILYAFPLLTVGNLFGTHWELATSGRFWRWDPTETFSLVTWILYAFYLILRWVKGWRGRKSTYLALAAFGIVLLTLSALFFFSPLHPMGRRI